MSITVDTPATIFDLAELGGATTQLHWAVVREMWVGGETFVLRRDGVAVALIGLYRIDGGAEAWFNIRPAGAALMLQIIRHMRLTLASRSYPEIVVLCTSKAGSRIARLCGFEFVEKTAHGEIWNARLAGEQ